MNKGMILRQRQGTVLAHFGVGDKAKLILPISKLTCFNCKKQHHRGDLMVSRTIRKLGNGYNICIDCFVDEVEECKRKLTP